MTVIKIAAINQKEGSPNKESPLILFCEMLEFSLIDHGTVLVPRDPTVFI